MSPWVQVAIGYHPKYLGDSLVGAEHLQELLKLLGHPQCEALGEVGLDYHHQGMAGDEGAPSCKSESGASSSHPPAFLLWRMEDG